MGFSFRFFSLSLLFSLFSAIVISGVSPAGALTLDDFDGTQTAVATSFGPPVTSVASVLSAVGGTRSFLVQKNSGFPGLGIRLVATGGAVTHSQDTGVTGTSEIAWDGDMNPDVFNPVGLGGVDLTEDGATALRLGGVSFDYPSNVSATVRVIVYDASDATANTASQALVVLDTAINNSDIDLPFSSFTQFGPGGPADFSNVGGLKIQVISAGPDTDLRFDFIGTDGKCVDVPLPGVKIIDGCGVCGGDNSTCAGCDGVPNSGLVVDECGVCGGDGSTCTDCVEQEASPKDKKSAKRIKRRARIIRKRTERFAASGTECGGSGYDGFIQRATDLFTQISDTLNQELLKTQVVCPDSVCVKTKTGSIKRTLRKIGRKLYRTQLKAKLQAISDCGVQDHGSGGSGRSSLDYFKALKRVINKGVPTEILKCS